MASLQVRNGSWRVMVHYRGLQHFVTIGEADESEAPGVKARYEDRLRLLKQRLLTLPAGMDIVTEPHPVVLRGGRIGSLRLKLFLQRSVIAGCYTRPANQKVSVGT